MWRLSGVIILFLMWGMIPLIATPSLSIGGGLGIRVTTYYKETESLSEENFWGGVINPYAHIQLSFNDTFALDTAYYFMGTSPLKDTDGQETQTDHLLSLRSVVDIPLTETFSLSFSLGPMLTLRDFHQRSQNILLPGGGIFSSAGFYLKVSQRLLFRLDGNMILDISAAISDSENPASALLHRSSVSIGTTIRIVRDS